MHKVELRLVMFIIVTLVAIISIVPTFNRKKIIILRPKGSLSHLIYAMSARSPFISVIIYFITDGPIWLDKINNHHFAGKLISMMEDKTFNMDLKTHKKIYGTLVSLV